MRHTLRSFVSTFTRQLVSASSRVRPVEVESRAIFGARPPCLNAPSLKRQLRRALSRAYREGAAAPAGTNTGTSDLTAALAPDRFATPPAILQRGDSTELQVLRMEKVHYPEEAKRKGIQGQVTLRVNVSPGDRE
jgi:hypothetical protein